MEEGDDVVEEGGLIRGQVNYVTKSQGNVMKCTVVGKSKWCHQVF